MASHAYHVIMGDTVRKIEAEALDEIERVFPPSFHVTDDPGAFWLGMSKRYEARVRRDLISLSGETPVELWHDIYDAAIAAGCPVEEAVLRADERYWPDGAGVPDGYEKAVRECSPFRAVRNRIDVGGELR